MSYFDEMFARADIQKIRGFLLHGTDNGIDPGSYKERVDRAEIMMAERLREKYPSEDEFDKVISVVYDCVSAVENVYMEVGLQIGAMLTAQVCQNLKTALE